MSIPGVTASDCITPGARLRCDLREKNAAKAIVSYENVKFMDVLWVFPFFFTGIDLLDCMVSFVEYVVSKFSRLCLCCCKWLFSGCVVGVSVRFMLFF